MKLLNILATVFGLLFLNSILAAENASNPLAAVSNTDFRFKTFDLGKGDRQEFFIDGATMLNPKLKIKYNAHWWQTDVTGQDENGWESAGITLIYFPKQGKLESGLPYKVAVGFEWIVDLGDPAKGIGTGADQIAPFIGMAIVAKPGLVLIPLVQHFAEYNGTDVSLTASRLIALKTLSNAKWFKLDLKVPYDWNSETWPASVEFQLGKNYSPKFGAYIDVQAGLGGDKLYDSAVGVGFRFVY